MLRSLSTHPANKPQLRQRTGGLLRMAGNVLHWSAGPSWEDIAAAENGAKDPAPGPDGVRYAAWHRAGRTALDSCSGLMWAVMGGASLLELCAATLLVLLPRNVLLTEVGEVWHEASVLRPLGLQNAVAMLVQHSLNAPRSRRIVRHAHGAQQGFVPGRKLLANIFEADTEARIHAMRKSVHTIVVLICLDFVAAFPSAAHDLLCRAMVDAGLPDGLLAIVVKVYRTVALHIVHDGGLQLFSPRFSCW